MALSRDQILGAQDQDFEEVPVPEWGGSVRVRGLSGVERDKYEDSLRTMHKGNVVPKLANARARLVAWSAVDDEGKRIFHGDNDVLLLGAKSASALDRVFAVASRLSGISKEDVEELTEGFDDGPSEPSTSD